MNVLKFVMFCVIISCNDSKTKTVAQESTASKDTTLNADEPQKITTKTRKNPEDDDWNNNIYTNNFYKFKIEFPKEWEYDNGASTNTVARAGNREVGATYSAQVIHLNEPPVYPDDICKSLTIDGVKETITGHASEKEKLKVETGFLGNKPAYFLAFTHRLSSGKKTVVYLTRQIQCYRKSKLFLVTLNIPHDSYNNERALLHERVIDSFRFF
ncbi:MAG: hypothetical protein H7Y01_07570 [Ferruginibacter sp.]|nr:hypothetical protein [Chitinophagaceae bacterium]